ncbi:MAG: thiamine pyrophosphate-binding protein [Terriglobales bacterium]
MKPKTGAQLIVDALELGNVRCVFGLPGTQNVELFEALRQSGVRTVVATNELSAAFMAGGWARVTGETAVLLTIPGPGFTWALTGLAEARLDSVPLLHIANAPANTPAGRRFRQQEIDQAAIAGPLVKAVIDADQRPEPGAAVREGLLLARAGEPGPVLIHVSATLLGRDYADAHSETQKASAINAQALDSVRARVRRARRPLLLVGGGTNRCAQRLAQLVDQLKAPILTTPSARGVLPENHPFNLGFDPFAGNISHINELIESSDLVLVIGAKLSHSGTNGFQLKLPADRLVHVDASQEVIGANYPASLGVVADASDLLDSLLIPAQASSAWTVEELDGWRTRLEVRAPDPQEPRIAGTVAADARSFFRSLRNALPAETILVLDSGLHQILARRYYTVLSPVGLIVPTDLQSMGFAISTAIGAKLAAATRPVVALLGDGGFAMTAMELLSAIREGIQLVVIVFADGAFGQIRMQQLASYGVSHGVSFKNPDLELLTHALGARYELIGDDDVESVVRAALEYDGVTVIEVPVGDTFSIRRGAAVARVREATRRVAGPRMFRFLKALLARRR